MFSVILHIRLVPELKSYCFLVINIVPFLSVVNEPIYIRSTSIAYMINKKSATKIHESVLTAELVDFEG